MLAHFESQTDLAASEIKRLQARKRIFENYYQRLENCARMAIEVSGKQKIEGESSTLALQKNPPAVRVVDFEAVPAAYKITKVETSIDKSSVARDLRVGTPVPGAELVQSFRVVRR